VRTYDAPDGATVLDKLVVGHLAQFRPTTFPQFIIR
jgi:hypothetical protein